MDNASINRSYDRAIRIAQFLSEKNPDKLIVVIRVDTVKGPEYDAVTVDNARIWYPGAPHLQTWQNGQIKERVL